MALILLFVFLLTAKTDWYLLFSRFISLLFNERSFGVLIDNILMKKCFRLKFLQSLL